MCFVRKGFLGEGKEQNRVCGRDIPSSFLSLPSSVLILFLNDSPTPCQTVYKKIPAASTTQWLDLSNGRPVMEPIEFLFLPVLVLQRLLISFYSQKTIYLMLWWAKDEQQSGDQHLSPPVCWPIYSMVLINCHPFIKCVLHMDGYGVW